MMLDQPIRLVERICFMEGTDTPVVFIHGLWLHAASWAPRLDLFAQHGYALLAPDHSGAGKAEPPRVCPDTPDSPGRFKPLFEAAAANITPHSPAEVETDNAERGPLLLVMGGQDHTVPEPITKSLNI